MTHGYSSVLGALLVAFCGCTKASTRHAGADAGLSQSANVDASVNDAGSVVRLDGGQAPPHDAGDAGGPGDGGVPGAVPLRLGQFASGAVTTSQSSAYQLALTAGDLIRVSVYTLRGDLQPAAYLSVSSGAFVEPATYTVGEQQVVLNYALNNTGDHTIVVRAYQDTGSGSFLLRTECTGGPCAAQPVPPPDVDVRLLAINDFHGQIEPPSSNVGGAAWLSAHVQQLRSQADHHLFLSAGDLVGASPFVSARFHDEPTVEVMNLMNLDLAGVGNHEFDEGPAELLRLVQGGCHPNDGCQDGTPFAGADFEILAANVESRGGVPLFPRDAVRVFGGMPVGVIGMTLEGTRSVTVASAVEDLVFLNEVATVNALVPRLQAMGVETIVVVVHQGGSQAGDENACTDFVGSVAAIAAMVDDAVDVLLTGHTHTTYNCIIAGKVVTSAGSSGQWLTRVDLKVNGQTREPTVQAAFNHRVDHTLAPDAAVAALVLRYRNLVNPVENAVVGTLAGPLTRETDASGQSTLGFAIADSQLFATQAQGSQIAFMNRGGIRADLPGGEVTFGQAFAVQPFENDLVTLTLSGQQLKDLLAAQFEFGRFSVLQPSATLSYHIAPVTPGSGSVRVVPGSILINGTPLDLAAPYRISVNAFLSEGGDGHAVFNQGSNRVRGVVDSQAFIDYLAGAPSPLPLPTLDRISMDQAMP